MLSSSPGSLQVKQAKIQEFHELLDKIEDAKSRVEQLEFDLLQNTTILQKAKASEQQQSIENKAVQMSTVSRTRNAPNFDITKLNPEHQDLVNTIKDNITRMSNEIITGDNEKANLENECDYLAQQNLLLNQKHRQVDHALQISLCDQRLLKAELESSKNTVSTLDLQIKNALNSIQTATVLLSGLIDRQASLQTRVGSVAQLKKSIDNLKSQICLSDSNIHEYSRQIDEISGKDSEFNREKDGQFADLEKVLDWRAESNSLDSEISSLEKQLKQMSSKLNKSTKTLTRNQKRFEAISSADLVFDDSIEDSNPDTSIDELIEIMNASRRKTVPKLADLKEKLTYYENGCTGLSAAIEQLNNKLRKRHTLLQNNLKSLRERIDDTRRLAFEKEQFLLEQTEKLRLTMAQAHIKHLK